MTESVIGKSYLRDQSKNGMYTAMVVFGILGFLASIALAVNISALGVLALVGAIQLATKNKPVLTFNEKYLEYKPAPLASAVFVKYEDLSSVENKGKAIILHAKGRKKPVKVLPALFEKSERDEVAAHLSQLGAQS